MSEALENKEKSLQAFLAFKARIDASLALLVAASENHFNVSPDDVTWANAGSLNHIATELDEILEFAGLQVTK